MHSDQSTIAEAVAHFVRDQGTPQAAAALMASVSTHGDNPTPRQVGTQMGMSYLIGHHHTSEALSRFIQLKGNTLHYFVDDVVQFGKFITEYPSAACAIPEWASERMTHEVTVDEFVTSCVDLIASEGIAYPVSRLVHALKYYRGGLSTIPQVVAALVKLANAERAYIGFGCTPSNVLGPMHATLHCSPPSRGCRWGYPGAALALGFTPAMVMMMVMMMMLMMTLMMTTTTTTTAMTTTTAATTMRRGEDETTSVATSDDDHDDNPPRQR
jgi:hypothetical protein